MTNSPSRLMGRIVLGATVIVLACQDLKIIATDNSGGDSLDESDKATVADSETDADGDTDSQNEIETEYQSCEGFSAGPGDSDRTVDAAGAERSYILHIPDAYKGTAPVPLIIDFHPIGGSGTSERSSSPYPLVTDAEGVIMAFPDGLAGPSGTAWNIGPCCVDTADDLAFARAVVEDAQATACIDSSRIYAVGTSMGGGMANHLACRAADIFAAVAPASFDLIQQTIEECTPPRPIAVVSFRGTADPLVPYDGGYSTVIPGHPITFLGAVGTFEKWADINKCTGAAEDKGNGCQSYSPSQCEGGVEVMLCTDQGGGVIAGDPTIAWPILKRHPKP